MTAKQNSSEKHPLFVTSRDPIKICICDLGEEMAIPARPQHRSEDDLQIILRNNAYNQEEVARSRLLRHRGKETRKMS